MGTRRLTPSAKNLPAIRLPPLGTCRGRVIPTLGNTRIPSLQTATRYGSLIASEYLMGLLRRPEAAALSISETSFAWMEGFFMMWYRIDCIAVAVVLLPAPLDQYQQLSRGTRRDKGERTWRRKTLDTARKWCNRGYASESRRAERAYLFGRISGLRARLRGIGLLCRGRGVWSRLL